MNAIEIINMLKSDCEAQAECLKENQDVRWDVYDHDNWDDMVDSLNKLKKLLITGETHEQEI